MTRPMPGASLRPARDALLQALDRSDEPVRLFIRDDDAGWGDDRLMALLNCTASLEVPIDLAVIPQAMTPHLAERLTQRMAAQPLGLHQHGFRHCNHEAVDTGPGHTGDSTRHGVRTRKSEFGPARSAAERLDDLTLGRETLLKAFGDRLDKLFTPPWNRCTEDTPSQLTALGFAALSRDVTARPQTVMPEFPVHTDWSRLRRQTLDADGALGARVAEDLARHVGHAPAIGLMLHHAAMDDDECALLHALLQRWTQHPNARWVAMRDLLTERAE
jgi:hypothetical protein